MLRYLKDKISSWYIKPLLDPPRIHLYALCWNDEKMLPHFFNHYDEFVDQYYIYDHHSTDHSVSILKSNPKVVLGSFDSNPDSFVASAQKFYNECWKESRGKADWVIICNIDEFFHYTEGLKIFLQDCSKKKYTIVQPEGYEMISDFFPHSTERKIYEQIREGFQVERMNKPQCFNPNYIREINFVPGRHAAYPKGKVRWHKTSGLKLLHYKFIGEEYWLPRQKELASGLGPIDKANNWGQQYLRKDEEKLKIFQQYKEKAIQVL